jgi:response regulator RpfG family c-di-GMP phosphodiesterase
MQSLRISDLCDNHIPGPRVRTLVVDDDPLVRETFAMILGDEGYEVHCAESGVEALRMLENTAFDIMLSDIFMLGQNGFDLLDLTSDRYPDMPVILITGYGNVEMARDALHKGARDFITKPCNHSELPIVVERNLARESIHRKNALRHRLALQSSYESALDALLSALNIHNTESPGHAGRVTAYTMEMVDIMRLSDSEIYHIERGALLHDIGKIGVPDAILMKQGKLTPEEWEEMRRHPEIGYEICSKIDMLREASQIVLRHHEAWDGSGYPSGMQGDAIPLGARIFAISDTLDAMTSDRPYRAALSFAAAREEVARFSGRQFDPEVVKVFLSVPEERWRHIRSLFEE